MIRKYPSFSRIPFEILNEIKKNRVATCTKISFNLGIAFSNISKHVKLLVVKGYISSKRMPNNGRTNQLTLLRNGQAVLNLYLKFKPFMEDLR